MSLEYHNIDIMLDISLLFEAIQQKITYYTTLKESLVGHQTKFSSTGLGLFLTFNLIYN